MQCTCCGRVISTAMARMKSRCFDRRTQGASLLERDQLVSLEAAIASAVSSNPAMRFRQSNGVAADLDGDGAPELIYKPGAYSLKTGLRAD